MVQKSCTTWDVCKTRRFINGISTTCSSSGQPSQTNNWIPISSHPCQGRSHGYNRYFWHGIPDKTTMIHRGLVEMMGEETTAPRGGEGFKTRKFGGSWGPDLEASNGWITWKVEKKSKPANWWILVFFLHIFGLFKPHPLKKCLMISRFQVENE